MLFIALEGVIHRADQLFRQLTYPSIIRSLVGRQASRELLLATHVLISG